MLEKAFYRALIEDQVERIKDIILDDDEMDGALEKTANLIVKMMKKQLQGGASKSELSEELDHELEKILRKKGKKEDEDEVEDEKRI
jgi:deoxyhypusine synthase